MVASALFNQMVSALQGLYGDSEAASLTRMVFLEKLRMSRTDLALDGGRLVADNDVASMLETLGRLETGEPVQQVLGFADFYGLRFKVNKHVLIPRPETEELVQWIIQENQSQPVQILDIGTGSGCISISLAKNLPHAKVSALDISTEALYIARENAGAHNMAIDFINSDILDPTNWPLLGKYDIIVSNPPYVLEREREKMHKNVVDFEPYTALFVRDNDPLLFYNGIGDMAISHLNKGGLLYFEINEAFGKETVALLHQKGYKDIVLKQDMNGRDRFVGARLK